jgi:hypothetical protein
MTHLPRFERFYANVGRYAIPAESDGPNLSLEVDRRSDDYHDT